MQVIEIYVAEDGKQFDTEWECIKYEDEVKARKYGDMAFLYGKDGERLPLSEESFEEAFYVVAKTDDAAAFMAHQFRGWSSPWSETGRTPTAGCWVFHNDEWISAETIFNLARIIEKIS